MQKLNKTIKRMVAIGTGVAMLGATMSGVVAQDLSNYPQPFIDANGVFNDNTAIVVGANAAASDTLGAVDVAQRLQFDAKVPVAGGDGTITVAGGVTEDIPLGKAIGNDTAFALDWKLDDNDIESFQDTQVNFQSADYDIRDILVIVDFSGSSPSIETSLSSSDDDYEDNLFMEAKRASMRYYYHFDDSINISKTTSSDSLDISFLGKKLDITNIAAGDGTKFTAFVGTEFFMDVGDTVTISGKRVTLENVGEGGAILVDVDGEREAINGDSTETVNGIEISNDETFFTNEISERSASLIIGETSEDTYKDGDEYVGEDENDPDWVWSVGNLHLSAATGLTTRSADPSGPWIGIENDFVKNDDTDDPAGVGECYDLPNNFVSVCFDSLTVPDEDYLTVTVEFSDGVDTDKSGHPNGSTSANTIYIHAPGDDRFIIKTAGWTHANTSNTVNNADTSEIWLQFGNGFENETGSTVFTNATLLFFKDTDQTPSTVYGGLLNATSNTPFIIAQLDFENTENTNLQIQYFSLAGDEVVSQHQIRLNFTGDSTTELADGDTYITSNWSIASDAFNALGATKSSEEAGELTWITTNIGTRDEDHRGLYGEIIKDPKSNGASDQVVVLIPGDQVQANVVVRGTTTTVSGGAVSFIPADIDIDTRLDSELGTASNFDLILLGGPCANNAVESVTGLGITCSGWSLGPGEAMLKFGANGDNVALLVAGTNAIDTRMAAKVLKNYDDYALSGSEAKITGTLGNPVVTSA